MKKICLLLSLILTFNSLIAQWDDPNFFPRAAWLQSTFRAEAYKDAGMNMYIGLWNTLDSTQLADLTNAGMYLITKQTEFGIEHINDTIIAAWKQDKSEPDNAQWNRNTQTYDPCFAPAVLINRYNEIKLVDPLRPVFIGLGRGVADIDWIGRGACHGDTDSYKEDLDGYIKGGDIVSYDIYPVNSTLIDSEKLWYVPKGVDSLIAWSSTPKKYFAWIEATKFDASSNRGPTPEEVKSEVWMAIIHGARGIGYFCHRLSPDFDEAALLHDPIMIENVKNINLRIDSLAAIINSPNTNYTSVVSSNTNVPIDIMTKSYGNYNYIFSVAMRPGTTTATFQVPSGSIIEVIGENRTLNESGGGFTDSFEDYGVHIYKVSPITKIDDLFTNISGFEVFPNPTNGQIYFEMKFINFDYRILSTSNQLLMNGKLGLNNIDISNLNEGTYFIILTNPKTGIPYSSRVLKNE